MASWTLGSARRLVQGTPQWRFDALEELKERLHREKALDELQQSLSTIREAEVFTERTLERTASRTTEKWTRMHFASHARWSEFGWSGEAAQASAHAHVPNDEKEIRRWLTAAILYIRSELAQSDPTNLSV